MKTLVLLLLLSSLSACALQQQQQQQQQQQKVTIYTFIYPPFTDHGPSGMFIDLITEAYKTQGIAVQFEFDTLENAFKKAQINQAMVLGSRRYKAEYADEIGFEEFYSVNTSILSIEGRKPDNKLGAFSSDEVIFAQKNKLIPVKYTTPSEGLKLLSNGEVGSIICTDINCDQIKLTNPEVKFKLAAGYSFPVDLVYFGSTPSKEIEKNISALKTGIQKILANGRYMAIQDSYKVSNPIFQIPLEGLLHIEIDE